MTVTATNAVMILADDIVNMPAVTPSPFDRLIATNLFTSILARRLQMLPV
jgi:hypothetical protein